LGWFPRQNFIPSGPYAANSFRYYRWIIQTIPNGKTTITPSIFFASDSNGPIGVGGITSGKGGNVTTSANLSSGHLPNWTMNDYNESWQNFFGVTSGFYKNQNGMDTYTGAESTLVYS
jgi:hypothetical protein